MKHSIISNLSDIEFDDIGTDSDESVDYPDYAHNVVKGILSNSYSFGILICGSGIGMSMSANRVKDIRAALCLNSKMAELARQHNDANILVLGSRLISVSEAIKCLLVFLNTKF
ncbi:MAG: ribose-5-phosphate isomerase, partial [Rickettsiales bacterium]